MSKIRACGLTLCLVALFLLSFAGQLYFGFKSYNEDARLKHEASYEHVSDYLMSGHFISSVAENWESEFLQMSFFVLLTAFLYQEGSAESHPLPEKQSWSFRVARMRENRLCEMGRRRRPVLWRLYENSLTLSLMLLFVFSFGLHVFGTQARMNRERVANKLKPYTVSEVLADAQFWFESCQNWQSEFFSIAILGLLSIHLRQKGSSQSKRLYASSKDTGI
jgi:hypothetical protein